ncbi:MAG TPA: YhjD/YihY/BrkB family envelope integrity protein [Ornithinibacter sp.]|nr:YhjD/YihY/BrkB family envelope integrity protein [Ornithinibacter sp.]
MTPEDEAPPTPALAGASSNPPGVVERVRTTARRASAWSVAARETHQSVDVGFRLADRDKRVAAGVLAGGVAYRLFFWLISLSVLLTGAFGVARGAWPERMLATVGLGSPVSDVIIDLTRGAQENRWWALLVGGWLVLWTGYLGGKALVLVHAAVWGVPPPPPPRPWVMSLSFTATGVALVAAMSVTAWLHATSQALAVLAALASTALPGAIWLAVSRLLPHRGQTWRGLAPGAILVAVGIQVFTILTIWFLVPKLASATDRYGLAGITATLLFWLYVLGRLFIAAATLNASLHEQRTATADTGARSSR